MTKTYWLPYQIASERNHLTSLFFLEKSNGPRGSQSNNSDNSVRVPIVLQVSSFFFGKMSERLYFYNSLKSFTSLVSKALFV